MPDIGDQAPDLTLESTDGPIRLSERLKKGRLLLAFYFEDGTPACSTEIATLVDVYEPIRELDGDIVAISADRLASHNEFAARLRVPFALVSDPDLEAAQRYDAVSEEDPKRSRRALFVIEQDGAVSYAVNPYSPTSLSQLEGALRAMGLEI